jgi:diguanylate cyclase (GGDEF)-like protein
MEREIQRADRTERRFCLLMIDMDDLKPINDTFGHHYGDRMLRTIGEVIQSGIRTIDAAARYGGDEFVVLLPETDPTGGFVVAEKLRDSISKARVDANGRQVQTTVSIGVVAYPDDGENAEQLLMAADATMYESKRKGKNRVVGRTPTRARKPPEPALRRAAGRRPGIAPSPAEGRGRRAAAEASRPEELQRSPERARPAPARPGQAGRTSPAGTTSPGSGRGKAPDSGPRRPQRRGRRLPGTEGGQSGSPRATRRFQVLGDEEEEQIGRIMRQLLGPPASPRPIATLEPGGQSEVDNRPA